MIGFRSIFFSSALLGFLACQSGSPNPSIHDGGSGFVCSPYADLIAEFSQNGMAKPLEDAEGALGPPNESQVPLTKDTVLALGFLGGGGIVDEDGDDIEFSLSGDGQLRVEVSSDGRIFVPVAAISESVKTIDISAATVLVPAFLRLVVEEGSFMLDSVKALHVKCPDDLPDAGANDASL